MNLGELTMFEMALERGLLERSFYDFVKAAWHLVEPETEFRDNWHIRAICEHLQAAAAGTIPNLLINVPPGSMKSLLVCVFWPAWVWTTRPGKRFMFASYSDALTMRDSVRCRTVLTSTWYLGRWPLIFREDQNTKGLFENTRGGWRLATSVGGKGTGLHPDIIVADDPNNASEAESDAERLNVINWWDGTISTRGVSRGVVQVIIQQRLHTQDLTGHVMEKGGWDQLCFPMRYEDGRMATTRLGFQDPRKIDGELLWPTLFPEPIVARLEKQMGIYHAAGQLQQRPSPRGGGMFKREWYEIIPVLPRCISFVRYWDKAGTAGGEGARSAGVLMASTLDGQFVIIDVQKDRLSATDRERLIKLTAQLDAQRFGYGVRVWVEQEPGSGGKESAENTVKNLVGFSCEIERVTGEKQVRAEPFAAQSSVRQVKILEGHWNGEFLDELENFPMGKLKDQVDAAAGAFNKLAAGTGAFGAGSDISIPAGSGEPDFVEQSVESFGSGPDFFG